MRNILDPVIGFIHRHRPARAGRYVMPYLTILLTILVALSLVQIKQTRDYSAETQDALCALRVDVEQRVAASQEFLDDHPEGFLGIPAASIKISLKGQERTIAALADLSC